MLYRAELCVLDRAVKRPSSNEGFSAVTPIPGRDEGD